MRATASKGVAQYGGMEGEQVRWSRSIVGRRSWRQGRGGTSEGEGMVRGEGEMQR
jgi:hypothetical protein